MCSMCATRYVIVDFTLRYTLNKRIYYKNNWSQEVASLQVTAEEVYIQEANIPPLKICFCLRTEKMSTLSTPFIHGGVEFKYVLTK